MRPISIAADRDRWKAQAEIWRRGNVKLAEQLRQEISSHENIRDRVLALHERVGSEDNWLAEGCCHHDLQAWPCETVRAVEGTA